MNIATSPRQHIKIGIRKISYFFYAGIKRIVSTLKRNNDKDVHNVLYYPVVRDKETLADLVNRVIWYFPADALSNVRVRIPVNINLANIDYSFLVPPESQQNYISKFKNIEFIRQREIKPSEADIIMVWNNKGLFNPRVWPYFDRTAIVDPTYYSTIESRTYQEAYDQTIARVDHDSFNQLSKKNYQELLNLVAGYSKGYVFGTGPSLDRAFEFNYSNSFCVVCNSMVKNKALLNYIKPQLLVFSDPVFHFSPCRYAAEFRQMMLEAVDQFQCYIMLPEQSVLLLLAHYPNLKSKIIGMPKKNGKVYNFPTADNFFVRGSKNVLTMFMLPVVSSVVGEIYIIGADGRQPDEKYFWRHSVPSQFNDLMQTAVDTHPSFFRDRVYTEYYKEHCKFLEGLVNYGESLGKSYYSLTPSYIPVLAQRQTKGGKLCEA